MRRYLILLALAALIPTGLMAQSMSDEQVIQFVTKEHAAGTSQAQIVTKLMQKGVDISQIRRVRQRYERQINQKGLGVVADQAVSSAENRMRQANGEKKENEQTRSTNMVRSSNEAYTHTFTPDEAGFAAFQEELGMMLPTDTAALVRQLLAEKNSRKVFGRDIFNNKLLTFEPNMNIATPQNYRLGPGDAVIIDVYGASQKSVTATVSPDGDVTI